MATKADLTAALKASDKEVEDLEEKVEDLEEKVEDLEEKVEDLQEAEDKAGNTPTLKELKESLCDRYAVNHHTEWPDIISRLTSEICS